MADVPVPDTAMDTKSEDADFSTRDATPLSADERALLDALREDAGTPDIAGTTLPGQPPAGPADALDPVFREPTA